MAVFDSCIPGPGATPSTRSTHHIGVLMLILVLALITSSCATNADAAGNGHNALALSASLPAGNMSQAYNAVLTVSGGSAPYQFSVDSGSLPPGVTLNRNTGSLTGTPSASGTYTFEILATDSPAGDRGSQTYIVKIHNSQGGINVSVSPTTATLASGATQQFTATVTGTSNTAVTWTASSGSIDGNGLYTAPTVKSQASVTITATSQASTHAAKAAITVNPDQASSLQITTTGLAQGQQGSAYSETFGATGGTQPYTWSVTSGNVPSGLTLSAGGALAGTPKKLGTFSFSVMVTDSQQLTSTANFSMNVSQNTGYDGPAQLPLVTIPVAMSDSPAPGSVITVNAGGDFQGALDKVKCGQTIELQAGATFTGYYTVRAKKCDADHWIIIRTSSPDSVLPAEGQRLTPCYAGVSSLTGRPAYSCSSPQNVLPKLQMEKPGNGPVMIEDGANFYRFIGLEITRPVDASGIGRLINLEGTGDHIIVDRCWVHGQAQDETYVGFSVSGGTYIAVINSYLNDFHCIAVTGACTDAHAISGGIGDTQDGPYLIQNNFLEASTESVMFGGGPATKTPADIEIIGNHFWKPWQWMQGNSPFVGGVNGRPFVVKNHIELKNAARVLAENNLFENCWGGFTQNGFAILLTPKNQHSAKNHTNVCPLCQVTDVTIRYSQISHAGGGMVMATVLSGNGHGGAPALAGARFSIHDVVMDDLDSRYGGAGEAFKIGNNWPKNPLNTITIDHVTAFPEVDSHVMSVGNLLQDAHMYGFVFTNNLVLGGDYPISNAFMSDSCAYKGVPLTMIANCFTTYTFEGNGMIASSPNPASSWPKGNLFPKSTTAVQFADYNNGNGGNYALLPGSPYKNAGTDGKDIGADITGLTAALAGVE